MKLPAIFRSVLLGITASLLVSPLAHAAPQQLTDLQVGVAHLPSAQTPGGYVRTPEGVELPLAQKLAQSAKAKLTLHQHSSQELQNTPAAVSTHLNFARVSPGTKAPPGTTYTALPYEIRPMAIMRTDTDLRQWADLRARTACMVAGSPWVGQMTQRHHAIEQIYGSPTEALIAVRVGECDVMVHDDRFLDALLVYPEWQKFSAQLRDTPQLNLVIVTAAEDKSSTDLAKSMARQWQSEKYLDTLLKSRAQEIAFEVYLEQDAVDCH